MMEYINLTLGDFLRNLVMMSNIEVIEEETGEILYTDRLGQFGLNGVTLSNGLSGEDYGVMYVYAKNDVLVIAVMEI